MTNDSRLAQNAEYVRPSGHTVEVRLVAKWGAEASMICHYDVADPKRPCWPHDEEGVPYPQERGEKDGCVYLDWFDNDGLESLGGETKVVRFDLGDAEWDGDGFTFVLGTQIDSPGAQS